MLYAAAVAALGRIYDLPQFVKQSESLKEVIRKRSYDGEFFVDNAVRQGGKLVPTRNRTETCQYYALYFRTATPETYPKLWETLRTVVRYVQDALWISIVAAMPVSRDKLSKPSQLAVA